MGNEKKENLLLALLLIVVLFGPVALRFDFYYDLNDDVLIKDILSGVYAGHPSGHTMQLLYPLGFLLSLLYRGLSIPVFGIFLLLCQYGSIFCIAYRSLFVCRRRTGKALVLLTQGAFWAAAFGMHLVFLQYTVTAGMLAGAAIFWVLLPCGAETLAVCDGEASGSGSGRAGFPDGRKVGNRIAAQKAEGRKVGNRIAAGKNGRAGETVLFLRENLPALALYWTAFCLRSEMALLLLPLAGVAGLCRWGWEARILAKETIRKYLSVFGVLVLGLLLCQGADSLAYGQEEWTAFGQFFDARTELYDYQKDFIDHYEENAAAYEALGVIRQRQALLENYNFGVDDGIDSDLLLRLEEAALARPEAGGLFRKSLSEGIWSLGYGHWTNGGDFPFNAVLLLCAAAVFGLGIWKGKRYLLWQAPLCMACGAGLWLFLLLRDRPVDRVLHPLYLGQILVFAGILLAEAGKSGAELRTGQGTGTVLRAGQGAEEKPGAALQARQDSEETVCARLVAAVGIVALCLCLPQAMRTFRGISEEYARREAVNETNEAVMAYCSAHPGRLYLADVYSTVSFSEKISTDRNKPFNYDLLGGWLVKSPLTKEKLAAFGFSSMGEAVCAGAGVSLLAETGRDMQWLEEFFAAEGIAASVVHTGSAADGMEVYQVLLADTGLQISQNLPER